MKSLFSAALLTAIFLCSCSKDKTGSGPEFQDIGTGVMLDGKEIIMADHNLGADNLSKYGTYYSWYEAQTACPSGYHLLTITEISEIIQDPRFNTGWKLMNGELQFTPGGYIFWLNNMSKERDAVCYYFLSESNPINSSEAWCIAIGDTFKSFRFAKKADRMPVRCVKNYPE